MPFDAIPKPAIAEGIVAQLLLLIREKELRPGDKLPPERELATMLGVSRPSLREALRTLSIMRVVELRQGSGSYISSLEPEMLVEHLDFVFALDDSTYLQLFETRKVLEPGICALAAQRITEDELAQLDACIAQTAISGDAETYFQADITLHEIITTAARNPLLRRFMASIRQLGQASRRRTSILPGIAQQTHADHCAIIEALRAHDPIAASQTMLNHLLHVEQRLKDEQIPVADKP
jgi:GntR family transcriptional repressor for pyruvate dehydrogenase complex